MNPSTTPTDAPLSKSRSEELGLYIHIPFCAFLCHYCDFAKTALWDAKLVRGYFTSLQAQLQAWLQVFPQNSLTFRSVYLGGGTPSLFTDEYESLFTTLRPLLSDAAEITIEANPKDISRTTLRFWRGLGINRISVGVQSFDDSTLEFFKRDHTGSEAHAAIALAKEEFPQTSLDLIYGAPAQSTASWIRDLTLSRELTPDHISLYNLTYAPGTPIGRAQIRGALHPMPETREVALYKIACSVLQKSGYEQYEVSNWCMKGRRSQHNQIYWKNQHYLAIGAGAHGFLPTDSPWGVRYDYPRSIQKNIKIADKLRKLTDMASSVSAHLGQTEANIESRGPREWLHEYIAAATRTADGICLERIRNEAQFDFRPNQSIQRGLDCGLLTLDATRRLRLSPSEWFRENFWCIEIMSSFSETPPKKA